jgi:hypothetical protein
MEIEIANMVDLENGTTELTVNMDDETVKFLLNFAIIEIIKRGLHEVKEMYDE